MTMSPFLRKAALVTHVTCSVAWSGAVAAFLVLSVVGATSGSRGEIQASYVAMNLIGLYAIVPLSLAALLTGLVQALGTPWGLVRHYWVLVKFGLTLAATALLLLHQFTAVAAAAKRYGADVPPGGTGRLGTQLIFDAAAALVVLVAITAISIFKPWGLTPYGRALAPATPSGSSPPPPRGFRSRTAVVAVILFVAAVVIWHLTGHGMHHGR